MTVAERAAIPIPGLLEVEMPVDAEAVMTFSPSPSHPPSRAIESQVADNTAEAGVLDERAPLLGARKERKSWYRPRPLWIVPFALLSSIARGMTLAPRVQVFTQLSCNALHQNYNHTNAVLSPASPTSNVQLSLLLTHVFDHNMPLPILLPEAPNELPQSLGPPVQDPSKACLNDPTVVAGAARLQTAVMVTMGILSALTTSFWGHFSEKYGRTKVLAASSFGLFITDFAFLLAVQPSTSPVHITKYISPHVLLLMAPIMEGLLGGFTTLTAAISAYTSDCTSDGSRVAIFSRVAGISYAGLALGPAIGGTILRHSAAPSRVVKALAKGVEGPTDGVPGVIPLFTVAIACTIVNFLFSIFLFPESVHKARLRAAAKVAAAEGGGDVREALAPKQPSFVKRLFGPLAVFSPNKTLATANGGKGRDWSLTWLGIGIFCVLLSAGIFQIKYLFAEQMYGWDSEQLSYYITFVGGLRAVNMLVLTPFIISHFKPQLPRPGSSPSVPSEAAAMAFDLRVARACVFLDVLSHTLVLSPLTTNSLTFCLFTGLNSIAAAVIPAAQSVAVSLFNRNPRNVETGVGALFGAMSAIQATGQMILGPLLFGLVFSTSVATFPKAIFAFASGLVTVGFAALLLIRTEPGALKADTRKGKSKASSSAAHERGRSRAVKHVGDRHAELTIAVEPSASGSGAGSSSVQGTSTAVQSAA